MGRSLKFANGQQASAAFAAVVLLVVSFVCGGSSRDNELRLLLAELSSLPLLGIAVVALSRDDLWRRHRFAVGLALAALAAPLLQLIPLPPAIWTHLPGREDLVLALSIAGQAQGWVPLSLTPDFTFYAALALIPPLAMFGGALTLRERHQRRLVWAMLALTGVSMAVAILQFVVGPAFYVWDSTRDGAIPGLFMNRNHMASLCLAALPFTAVLAAGDLDPYRRAPSWRPWLLALFGLLVMGVIALTRSRAGLLLLPLSIGGSFLAAWIASGRGRPSRNQTLVGATAAIAALALAALAFGPTLARFDVGGAHDVRFDRWPQVVALAQTYLPLGAGVGSFDAAYRSVETLQELDPTYFNNAHNDYLEIWLELGWLGVGLIAAFLYWFGKRSLAAWRGGAREGASLQRAASLAILTVLLHSIGDYPLRTTTLAVVFALCCAILEMAGHAPASTRRRRA